MIKNFVCVCTGNKYGTMYVDKLYNMVTRHSNNVKFNVITDSKKDWRPEINQIIVSPLFPTWWNKIHMFRDDIGLEGRVLFMDLDIVVIRNIDHLWDFGLLSKKTIVKTNFDYLEYFLLDLLPKVLFLVYLFLYFFQDQILSNLFYFHV